MKISVCCPSYKRPLVETLKYIPYCKVYVDKNEYSEYISKNKGANIVCCDDGIQGNLCRVRNYILKKEFEGGADVVIIVDDDMEGIYRWIKKDNNGKEKVKIETDDLMSVFEKYSQMCMDLGYKFWGMNCNQDAMSYREYNPFNFSKYIGGPFQAFINGNECMYDERLPLKEDYDMTIQQCNKYRGCLRVNFLTYNVKQSKQAGGCASYRNMKKEAEQFRLLQRKWGDRIVKYDNSNKGRSKKQKVFDYNPIVKIPIKGI